MRDPERIDPILDRIRGIWKKNPDLRLCQIVSVGGWQATGRDDVFYVEDDELMEGLDVYFPSQKG